MAAVHIDFDLSRIDWTAIAALATLVLAAFTYRLARSTTALSQATAAEVAAQARPVLIPGSGGIWGKGDARNELSPPIYHTLSGGQLRVNIENGGPGIALNIDAVIDPADGAKAQSVAAIPSDSDYVFIFPETYWGEAKGPTRILMLVYQDIAGRQFTTEILFGREEDQGPFSFFSAGAREGD